MDRLNFVIYGATGKTGYYCLKNLIKINSEKNKNYTFAIAGRNQPKLKKVLEDVGKELKQDTSKIKIIEANADNKQSLVDMTKQCKVMITVVGPYLLYGMPLIEACIETFTHYVDISGENQFLEKVQVDYFDQAKEKGLYIISSCGFGSIPAELGCLYLKDKNPDAEIKTVEGFLNLKYPKGFSSNTGSFFSLLEFLKNYKDLGPIRTAMFDKFYKKKTEIEKPKVKLYQKKPFAKKGFYVPFGQIINPPVVERTQLFFFNENESDKPLSLVDNINVSSFLHLIGLSFAFLSISVLNLCSFTRNLLMKYPKLFTLGVFSKGGSTKEQIDCASFEYYLCGKGIKKNEPSVNVSKTLYIQGPELAYEATSILLLNAGIVILEELDVGKKENAGVVTPGYAFRKSRYISRIRELGFEFRIIDDN